jgi:hypothetical protein
MPATTAAVEPRIREVSILVEVIRLVRKTEIRKTATAQLAVAAADWDARSALSPSGYNLWPVQEELVVVEAEPMAMR